MKNIKYGKNIILLSTLVIMILSFIIGCKKEKATESQVMNENSVFKFTIVDNRLSFSSIAEYENQIALMSTLSDDSLINASTTDLFSSMY